jgi:hypothetical protein
MEILKDIPARISASHQIAVIVLNIVNKKAYVQMDTPDGPKTKMVDVMPLIEAATTTQRAVIRGFIKNIVASAMEIDVATVPEVFETE